MDFGFGMIKQIIFNQPSDCETKQGSPKATLFF